MRLAEYTDYSLRVLMYCAARPERLVTITELADFHRVSRNHLMKIVTDLGRMGLLETMRGRGGGLRLLKDPAQIRVGDVVRACETDFRLAECFAPGRSQCTLNPSCRLKGVFAGALQAYFKELDAATLADIAGPATRAAKPASPARGDGARVAPPRTTRRPAKAA